MVCFYFFCMLIIWTNIYYQLLLLPDPYGFLPVLLPRQYIIYQHYYQAADVPTSITTKSILSTNNTTEDILTTSNYYLGNAFPVFGLNQTAGVIATSNVAVVTGYLW